jgi:hypothetical protein
MKYFFVLFLAFQMFGLQAQSPAESTVHTCYAQWETAFNARGSEDVADGWHEGVIVSIRHSTGKNECLMGKVQVKEGKIGPIYLKYVDNKYEEYRPESKKSINNNVLKINPGSGISTTLRQNDDTLVNIIFKDKLKPKKKSFQQAPLPDLDDL